jgi:hypothetical protein
MSYEGFEQYLCENGHYHTFDAYEDVPKSCPFCDKRWAWRHSVDQTNGEIRGCPGTRPVRLKQIGEEEVTIMRPIYAIPAKAGQRLLGGGPLPTGEAK